ncbi:hypothetical protein A0H81_07391 [Grifola frondosa]|uniref:Uncharacterized protein n=1 Tax=Grifola frondosa TaxID=5627 RepID=A0A1C7M5R5_GRIFR|nr:hypothetical protein A0H81_07391 [Grifola frondosa]
MSCEQRCCSTHALRSTILKPLSFPECSLHNAPISDIDPDISRGTLGAVSCKSLDTTNKYSDHSQFKMVCDLILL